MNLHTYPELMTVDEMSEYLRTSKRTILNWASRGEVPAGKIGSEWRFRREDIRQWVDSRFQSTDVTSSPIKLEDLISKDNVLVLTEKCKEDVLNRLLLCLSDSPNVTDENAVSQAIFKREELMSTGIGLQIAVPHARVSAVTDITVGVALTEGELMDYDSIDSKPVRLVIMIIAREDQHKSHLQALSLLSNRLKCDVLRQRVLESKDANELYERLIAS